jgi:hypothetical protein
VDHVRALDVSSARRATAPFPSGAGARLVRHASACQEWLDTPDARSAVTMDADARLSGVRA